MRCAGRCQSCSRPRRRLVLDADALNAIAADSSLLALTAARAGRDLATILTPHPLEAARLLGDTAGAVQANRLHAARDLAARCQCVVVLKGSGTIVAAPGATARINATGNASLASAGTGDVLAGWIGGRWASLGGTAFDAATRVSSSMAPPPNRNAPARCAPPISSRSCIVARAASAERGRVGAPRRRASQRCACIAFSISSVPCAAPLAGTSSSPRSEIAAKFAAICSGVSSAWPR